MLSVVPLGIGRLQNRFVVGGYVRKCVVLRISIGLKICCIGNGGTAGEFESISQVILQVQHRHPPLTEKIGPPPYHLGIRFCWVYLPDFLASICCWDLLSEPLAKTMVLCFFILLEAVECSASWRAASVLVSARQICVSTILLGNLFYSDLEGLESLSRRPYPSGGTSQSKFCFCSVGSQSCTDTSPTYL